MDLEKELELNIRSRVTLVVVVTYEEERVLGDLTRLCERTRRPLLSWDHADHFEVVCGSAGRGVPSAKDPLTALEAIDKKTGDAVFLLRDFHQCWEGQPRVIRKLRSLAQRLKYTRKTIVVSSPVGEVPAELGDAAVILNCPPPAKDDLEAILDRLLSTPGVRSTLAPDERDHLVRSALGLSSNQAERVFAKAIVSGGTLDASDIAAVTEEKKSLVAQSGALELHHPAETAADVGGLEVLKDWLHHRSAAFGEEARAYGLPPPKGIALIGIPGTGKSLSAKMVGNLWYLPLVRMDVGALFGSLVGQSEENTRKALELVETISPCVLWIDEIEKGLSTGEGDGGTSMRVFGSILSWMQEKKAPVFVVATANDISRLPPELLRRGRFDEIFFLDLPTAPERVAIAAVHLRKRGRDPDRFDLERIAAASEGYVGAEIEQGIIEAMYLAFNDEAAPRRDFTTDDVVAALRKLVPMSHSQRERVEGLRRWVTEGRAQSASRPGPGAAGEAGGPMHIEPTAVASASGPGDAGSW